MRSDPVALSAIDRGNKPSNSAGSFQPPLTISSTAMTAVLFCVALFGIGTRAEAQNYPWCAIYGGFDDGGTNCGFTTFQQCMDTARGMGNLCQPNTQHVPPPGPRSSKQVRIRAPH